MFPCIPKTRVFIILIIFLLDKPLVILYFYFSGFAGLAEAQLVAESSCPSPSITQSASG
jgi:hypothetical protein